MAEPRLDQPKGARRTGPRYDTEAFGRFAEAIARFIGTARFLVAQTIVVVTWILWNVAMPPALRFDEFPFIFLTLMLSLQAAYAAPLILLAQTRQAERDKMASEKAERRHDEAERQSVARVAALRSETDRLEQLLQSNTDLTRQDKELTEHVAALTREIHEVLVRRG